jgi:hypothetical protein
VKEIFAINIAKSLMWEEMGFRVTGETQNFISQ